MKKNRKHLLITLCLMLVVCVVSVSGTLAWLTDTTDEVVNTFTPSDIEVTLDETKPTGQTAQMIPGVAIDKDPNVTASSDVDYYVFVKITKNNWQDWLTYSVTNKWTQLTDADGDNVDGVYYIAMEANVPLTKEYILEDNKVYVASDLEKEDMDDVVDNDGNVTEKFINPTLTFEAYAIQQQDGGTENGGLFTPYEAWVIVSDE